MTDGEGYLQLAAGRRSTRVFLDKPVPDDLVRRAIESAIRAPSACNRQLWHFVVVTEPEVRQRLARLGDGNSQSYLHDAPVIVAVFYDTSMESRNPCYTAQITTGMAIYGLLLAADALGLGAIYLGGISRPAGVAEAVEAPPHLRNLGVVCLGYRGDNPPVPPKRPVDEVISYNLCEQREPWCHPDIRPHVWSLWQLADFRDRLLWYKGIEFDAKTLHANPEPRFSPKVAFMTSQIGILAGAYEKPRVLDIFSHNGDLLLQLMNACDGLDIDFYAYDLTEGIAAFMRERFAAYRDTDRLTYLTNPGVESVRIPLDDNSVDVISCYERMGHFDDPAPLLAEMYRVLRPGGRAFVMNSNRYYPHLYRYKRSLRKNYALGRNWDFGPERKFAPAHLAQLFGNAGFRTVSVAGLQPPELKLFGKLARYCAKLKWTTPTEWLQDLQTRCFHTYGPTWRLSRSIAHILAKDDPSR